MRNYRKIKQKRIAAAAEFKKKLAKELQEAVTSDKVKKVENEGGEAPVKKSAVKKAAAKKAAPAKKVAKKKSGAKK